MDETRGTWPSLAMSNPRDLFPVNQESVEQTYAFIFAPWVKQLGLCDFTVAPGRVSARLPESDHLKFTAGGVCGQALMAAIDTVAVLATATGDQKIKGTAYQHTQFLRPALGDDMIVTAEVLRFGKSTAYVETKITFAGSGALVAHAVLEFAF
jgi:acyl-coenzyme A thioesterase PaaI-like protein